MAFIIQVSANNGRISPSCSFPALLIPFLDIAFINEGPTGCINEKSIIAPRKPTSCFVFYFILYCFNRTIN